MRTPQGYVLKAAKKSVMRLAGTVDYDGPPLSVEEMDRAAADGAVATDPRR